MSQLILSLLAILGGMFLAAQGGLNALLGVFLKNPLMAAVVAFFSSTVFALLLVVVSVRSYPDWLHLRQVPYYLWFAGGLCSVLGITLYYYTIPRLGMASMISLGLFGQVLFSVAAAHWGWLNLPVEPLTAKKALGVLSLVLGVCLINIK
jgi:transporter family-2 protein